VNHPEPLAGKLPRFASLCYEGILLVPVLFLAAYLFLAFTHDAQTTSMHHLFRAWLVLVMGAYFVYCWRKGGQTLPMKTWRLRLARSDGRPLTRKQAWLRYGLAVPGLLLFGVGFLWAFVDRDSQFLHDRLAGTRVFRADRAEQTGRDAGRAQQGVREENGWPSPTRDTS
jgi:uncharacterized RDD family membrane protein YckC